jgi:hypothetical protein
MATTVDAPLRRTWAQWYCLVGGAVLLVAGILGFIADSSFKGGDNPPGSDLIVFRVNGWHNLVHIASGLLLLAAANTRPTAKTIAMAFGIVYGLVTIWGLIDGTSVFGLIAINGEDNVLHVVLSVAAIACAYFSPTTKGQQRGRRREKETRRREKAEAKERSRFVRDSKKGVDAPIVGGSTSSTTKTPSGTGTDTEWHGERP